MTKITYRELLTMAQSPNPVEHKQAHTLFHAWIKAGPKLPYTDRLSETQKRVLHQIFAARLNPPGSRPKRP